MSNQRQSPKPSPDRITDDAKILLAYEKVADRASREISDVRAQYRFIASALGLFVAVGLWFFGKTYSDNIREMKSEMRENVAEYNKRLTAQTDDYVRSLRKESEAKMTAIDALNQQMAAKLVAAQSAVEAKIDEEFKNEKIKATVENVAASRSEHLLTESVQPSINAFNAKIDKRLADFDIFLKTQRDAVTADLQSLRAELALLQKRNAIVALADKAIGAGNVESYRTLRSMEIDPSLSDGDRAMVKSEMYRVIEAFGLFGPTTISGVKFVVSAINPQKHSETELTAEEVYPLLTTTSEPQARAKIGEFLGQKAPAGSYKIANALAEALKRETNLEAFRYLGGALAHITQHDEAGSLDYRELLEWWDKNQDEFRKKDPTEQALRSKSNK